MWISDTLSREYRNTTESWRHDTTEVPALEEINHAENLSIPPDRIKQLRRETTSDKTMHHRCGKEWMAYIQETVQQRLVIVLREEK